MLDVKLSKETIELALMKIDQDIKIKEEELIMLKKARQEFEGQQVEAPKNDIKRRLPQGLPKKLVYRILRQHKELSIGEVRSKILSDLEYDLRDSTARRALVNLVNENVITQREDGVYIFIEEKDDLPF